nr:MAG TPA: hypothetical protein [Bacteriophage sp.]
MGSISQIHIKSKPPVFRLEHRGFALLKNFCNAVQPGRNRLAAVVDLRCNVRQREPFHVPQ